MTKILLMLVILALAGCANMTPGQKTAAWIVGGVVVAGAVASSSGGGGSTSPNCFIAISGDKQTRVCN